MPYQLFFEPRSHSRASRAVCVCANTTMCNVFAYKDFEWINFKDCFSCWQRHPPSNKRQWFVPKFGGLHVSWQVCVFSLVFQRNTQSLDKPHWVSLSHSCYFSAISLSSVWEAFQIIQTRFWWYTEQATAELCRFGEDSAGAQCSFCLLSMGQSHILSGRCALALLMLYNNCSPPCLPLTTNTIQTSPYHPELKQTSWNAPMIVLCSVNGSVTCSGFPLEIFGILCSPWPYLWLSCD